MQKITIAIFVLIFGAVLSVSSTSSIRFQSDSNVDRLEKTVKVLEGVDKKSLTSTTNTIIHEIDDTTSSRHFNNDEPKENSEIHTLFIDAMRNRTGATYYHLKRIHRNDWKGLAMAVFCNTAAGLQTKVNAVRDALIDSYPSDSFMVFATDDKNGYAAVHGWDILDKRPLCGPHDLLVFKRSRKDAGCSCDVKVPATLLQKGAMYDASSLEQSRDLMNSRASIYGLRSSLVINFGPRGPAWANHLIQKCTNRVENVRNLHSFWHGDCTKK